MPRKNAMALRTTVSVPADNSTPVADQLVNVVAAAIGHNSGKAARMTAPKQNAAASVAPIEPAAPVKVEPFGTPERRAAFRQITDLAVADGTSYANLVDKLAVALGDDPTPGEIKAARKAAMIGRMAGRIPLSAWPANVDTAALRIAHAATIYDKAGAYAPMGEVAVKAFKAAKSAWSLMLADAGHGAAKTTKDKNDQQAGKRAPRPGANKGETGKAGATSTPGKFKSRADLMAYVMGQANVMNMVISKNAGIAPGAVADAVARLHSVCAGALKTD